MANSQHLERLAAGPEAWNQWRNENPGTIPDLGGADLSGRILSETNRAFRSEVKVQTNLQGALLRAANLERAVLQGANLSYADLRGAKLERADLRRANLTGADLRRARLLGTNLTLSKLSEARVEGAWIWETVFSRVNLAQVQGLESCVHPGPSLIDDRTFRDSGELPERFLQGCGLTDWQLQVSHLNRRDLTDAKVTDICYKVVELRTNPALQFFSCFISYSHKDRKFARKLFATLQDAGIRCWLDEHQLRPGDDIFEEVDRGINLWDKILVCCSKSALTSWWVDNEILSAFKKEQQLFQEKGQKVNVLIPLNLDGFMFSEEWMRGYRKQVLSRLAADFTGWQDSESKFESESRRVVDALRSETAHRKVPPPSKL